MPTALTPNSRISARMALVATRSMALTIGLTASIASLHGISITT